MLKASQSFSTWYSISPAPCASNSVRLRKALLKSREGIYLSLQVCRLFGGQVGNIFQWKDLILFCFFEGRDIFYRIFPQYFRFQVLQGNKNKNLFLEILKNDIFLAFFFLTASFFPSFGIGSEKILKNSIGRGKPKHRDYLVQKPFWRSKSKQI